MSGFEVPVPDGPPLKRGDTVAHIDHGPMHVDEIRRGASSQKLTLTSEIGPEAIRYTAERLREEWGETVHSDPMEIQQATVELGEVSVEGLEISAELKVTGDADFESVERVAVHARDELVRAMQAERDNSRPEYGEGTGVRVNWDELMMEDGDSA